MLRRLPPVPLVPSPTPSPWCRAYFASEQVSHGGGRLRCPFQRCVLWLRGAASKKAAEKRNGMIKSMLVQSIYGKVDGLEIGGESIVGFGTFEEFHSR